MLAKWGMMDINTRKYGAALGLCKWRYEEDKKGRIVFDGPEMTVLNNRDCAHEIAGNSMETLNWFQVREYITYQELQRVNDSARKKPIYENLDKLRFTLEEESKRGGDNRDSNWISRNRMISGLTDSPYGQDTVFKHIEMVTEYRKDEWITFAPKHNVVLRKIENPYQNYEIPITLLKYYPIDDDLYGLSEIEPIKSLQKAINALLCQYVDEINQKLYSPIAVGPGVRQSTLEWGKGARWLMQNPMTDFRMVESQSNAAQFFNNTYSALVAAMMSALGESSLGISNIDRYQSDKTATEVKYLLNQRNARDNLNQIALSDSIERQMKLWYSMNQVMLFPDKKKKTFIIRVAGKDAIRFFKEQEMDKMSLTEDARDNIAKGIQQKMQEDPTNIDLTSLKSDLTRQFQTPNYPVELEDGEVVPKFSVKNEVGLLYVEPADLMGTFDFMADVKSMTIGAGEDEKEARNKAITTILSNPQTIMLLMQEKVKPKFKDLFVAWLEDSGFKDAERFFENIPEEQVPPPPTSVGVGGGLPNEIQNRMTGIQGQPEVPPINTKTVRPNMIARQRAPNIVNAFGQIGVPGATVPAGPTV